MIKGVKSVEGGVWKKKERKKDVRKQWGEINK